MASLRGPNINPLTTSDVEVLSTRCVLHHRHNDSSLCPRRISKCCDNHQHKHRRAARTVEKCQKRVCCHTKLGSEQCSYPCISSDLGRYQISRLSRTSSSSENLIDIKDNTVLMYANHLDCDTSRHLYAWQLWFEQRLNSKLASLFARSADLLLLLPTKWYHAIILCQWGLTN